MSTSPYERLLELAGLEREAVVEGDWPRVQALQLAQESLRQAIGDQAPPEAARAQLEEAARLNQAVLAAIRSAIDGVQGELVKLSRERDAAAGYAATGYGAAGLQRPQLAWQG